MDPRMRLTYNAVLAVMQLPGMQWAGCEYQCPACGETLFTLNGVHDPKAPDIDILHIGVPGQALSEALGSMSAHFIEKRKCLDALDTRAKARKKGQPAKQPPAWYAPPPTINPN